MGSAWPGSRPTDSLALLGDSIKMNKVSSHSSSSAPPASARYLYPDKRGDNDNDNDDDDDSDEADQGLGSYTNPSMSRRFLRSFKRDHSSSITPRGSLGSNGKVFDASGAAAATAQSPLQRRLKGRHIQMIAIGGCIGTGLFVGSGSALSRGGPASLLIGFSIVGTMIFTTVQALGEMAVLFPIAGSFSSYSTRFLDPAWGFAMGWNYALQWLIILPLEIVSASLTIQFWNHGQINNTAWVALFLAMIVGINLCGVRWYGEAEFVFSTIKASAIIGFIILGIIINVAGGPEGSYIGGLYWQNPGAFKNGFKGLCNVFVTSAFAFTGTELVGLAAAEAVNPRKSLPTAAKQVFWRITLFYLISLLLVGLLVPYNDKRLLNSGGAIDTAASPFVIAVQNAGIYGLPSAINAVILIAVLSVGNSAVFGSSRTLAALAEQGQAPKILGYIDRKGRPIVAIGVAFVVGLLAFLAGSGRQVDAFNWMIAISSLSSIFTWASICLAHIRFRKGWRLQGHSLSELAFQSQAGVIGSWLGFIINIIILIAQFWIAFSPIGYAEMSGSAIAINFFQLYLAVPIVIMFYIPYKFWYGTSIVRSDKMDLTTGVRELNLYQLVQDERAERRLWPRWKKIYRFFC